MSARGNFTALFDWSMPLFFSELHKFNAKFIKLVVYLYVLLLLKNNSNSRGHKTSSSLSCAMLKYPWNKRETGSAADSRSRGRSLFSRSFHGFKFRAKRETIYGILK